MPGMVVRSALLGAWLAVAGMAGAAEPAPGGISISPVRVDLKPAERGSAVTLTNTGSERKTIQVEIYAWTQPGDEDVYAATPDIVVNPPLFFLAPGAAQVVRVGRSAALPATAAAERSYRIYFREVPEEAALDGPTLRVALRIGIPVFLAPDAGAAAPQLSWSGAIRPDGSAELRADNAGAVHARVADVRVLGAAGAEVLGRAEGFRYVLPHAHQSWVVPASAGLKPGPVRVAALLEEGAREFALVLRTQ